VIQDRDLLMIRPMPDLQETRYITLKGSAVPGCTLHVRGRLSSILQRAAASRRMLSCGCTLHRVSVQKRQQEIIDRWSTNWSRRCADLGEEAPSHGQGGCGGAEAGLEARKLLIVRLKSVRARAIIIHLSDTRKVEGTESDLVIEPGDQLTIRDAGSGKRAGARVQPDRRGL